ncbi:outer membrane protein [Camelimonas abortus]|uniref:Outer membrane protein n=1 Tax=Camelimonas abortus TaxID=1017184 RepID=A0ABV7LGU9_9HYPH
MNRIVVAAAVFAAMTTAGAAADLPLRGTLPALPEPAPEKEWTGAYVGVSAGAVSSQGSEARAAVSGLPFISTDATGGGVFRALERRGDASGTAGAQLGYNFQVDRYLMGVEADYNWGNAVSRSDFVGVVAHSVTSPFGLEAVETYAAAARVRTRLASYGTLRGRLGVLVTPQLLVYATGGLAVGSLRSTAEMAGAYGIVVGGAAFPSAAGAWERRRSAARWGWTLGGGVEFAVTSQLSLKGEYLYLDLGSREHVLATAAADGFNATIHERNRYHVLRAGVNYRF